MAPVAVAPPLLSPFASGFTHGAAYVQGIFTCSVFVSQFGPQSIESLLLALMIVAVFTEPVAAAYQIPAPGDVVAVLWTDSPELLRQAWPTTYATICGFLLSALKGTVESEIRRVLTEKFD